MKKLLLSILLASSFAWADGTSTNCCPKTGTAAEPAARKKARPGRAAILEKYDKNKDGKLDKEERAEMRREMDRRLEVRFDKNKDGKLDDGERAAYQKFIEARDARRAKMKEQAKARQAEFGKKMRQARKKAAAAEKPKEDAKAAAPAAPAPAEKPQ